MKRVINRSSKQLTAMEIQIQLEKSRREEAESGSDTILNVFNQKLLSQKLVTLFHIYMTLV